VFVVGMIEENQNPRKTVNSRFLLHKNQKEQFSEPDVPKNTKLKTEIKNPSLPKESVKILRKWFDSNVNCSHFKLRLEILIQQKLKKNNFLNKLVSQFC
jgi:hypothetical protein